MTPGFQSAAVSRIDGSVADGIHLLWAAPSAAGYSVKGFDIQRRVSRHKPKVECHALTSVELAELNASLRLRLRIAEIAVSRTPCPRPTVGVPNEPLDPGSGPPSRCVDFGAQQAGDYPNPHPTKLVDCLVSGERGVPDTHTAITTIGRFTGLHCSRHTEVRLAAHAEAVRVTLVCFVEGTRVEAIEADGTSAGSASITRLTRPQAVAFAGREIARLRIHAPHDETLLLSFCTGARDLARAIRRISPRARSYASAVAAVVPAAPAGSLAQANMAVAPQVECVRYRLSLRHTHQFVAITASTSTMLAIGLRDGKAVDSRFLADGTGFQRAEFELRSIDEVLLHVPRAVNGLTICVDEPLSPTDEDRDWAGVPFIASGIQLPLAAVDASLPNDSAELALASSRLLPGEAIAAGDFADVARVMTETLKAGPASPVVHALVTRKTTSDQFLALRPWAFAMATVTDAGWRRALGFGYLDRAGGLAPGTVYDYRITGHFLRRDLERPLLGFHDVPLGTTLPPSFHLGRVQCTIPVPRAVRLHPEPASSTLRQAGRIGLPLAPLTPGGTSLRLAFDEPRSRVVLELEPAVTGPLTYKAATTDFLTGIQAQTFTGTIVAAPRVTLDFASPIDSLVLRGTGLLYGIRLAEPGDGDPDDVVAQSVVVPAVPFVSTSEPPAPTSLGTTNLQDPMLPGDPAVTTQNPPQSLGFRLHWLPPPSTPPGPPVWPTDLATPPPFDVLGYRIERRQVDAGGAFADISGTGSPLTFFGNRAGRRQPAQLGWGADIMEVFPDRSASLAPAAPFITTDDVLNGPGVAAGPAPGSTFQYRISSVDVIGRRSAAATVGSVVRLEKHLAPPQPAGPAPSQPPRREPAGVRARVLQRNDPDLAPDDAVILGTSTNAIVLEWGWTAEERRRDPFATEFRVYWQPIPPDVARGTVHGPAVLVGGMWHMTATLDQPVSANALAGRYVLAPTVAFKVATNTAGNAITITFESSAQEPTAVPNSAAFEVRLTLDGSELRPSRWAERSALIPIGPGDPGPFVFRDRLTIDAANPLARVWVGVSAADDQRYVPDELPGTVPNGGRPGNESIIAAAEARARYLGRPAFVPPPPLAVVPELLSSEPLGDTVTLTLDLGALLPAVAVPPGHSLVLDRISAAAMISSLSRPGDGTIGVTFPDHSSGSYTLANASDQTALLAQIAAGEAALVEGRFLVDLAQRFPDELEPLWERAVPASVPKQPVTCTLPAKAERHLFRVRLADAAKHVSQRWAMLPRVIRVISTRAPGAPRIAMAKSSTDTVTLDASVLEQFDIRWLLVFHTVEDLAAPLGTAIDKASVLRVPDRRDLYPNDGIRLRLSDGTILSPTVVDLPAAAARVLPDLVAAVPINAGFARRVVAWAVAMTRDGIPSAAAGPITVSTGPHPLVVPTLSVAATPGGDVATWSVPAVPCEVSIERTLDGGVTWERISPWLPATTATFTAPGGGPTQYRIALRDRVGQSAFGTAVGAI